jgi:putative hemolysin
VEILIILLLILLNGVFAMSEIAMVSAKRSRLERAAKAGDKGARKAIELSENPGKFLSTVQIGITLIGILTGIYSGEKIEDDLIVYLNQSPLLAEHSELIATTIIVVALTFFSLVLGELVPKRIGMTMPEPISKILAFPMYSISLVMAPFIWLLTVSSDGLIRLFGIRTPEESKVTEEEIKAIIKEGTEEGAIEEIEKEIVDRVFNLGNRRISSLMTHRSDTICIEIDADVKTIRERVNQEMHSVYPVLDRNSDVLGIILLKDLFRHLDEPDFTLNRFLTQTQFISENLSAYEALKLFKSEKKHQAIVIDEYGQMQGLVTLNDLLEALVGDVSDFYEADFSFVEREDGSYLVDGQFPLHDLLLKLELEGFENEYPQNTLSGLILHELRRIPQTGDYFTWLGHRVEVVDMDGVRIDKVLIKKTE